MPTVQLFNLGGVDTYSSPILNGQIIHSLNVDNFPIGGKSKRRGYDTFLGTPDTSQVNTLFSWTKNDGTTTFLYRASGSSLYYSLQGTGAWTLAGNGTISNGGHVGFTVIDNTLILGDGVGSTRHTTNGTSFTDTTLAPVGEHFAQYQGRVYIGGTSSTVFYSTTNDATNWNTSGTSDSSSFNVPGAGKINKVFVTADRLTISKNSGIMNRWDGYSLVDMSTRLGPSSPYSVAEQEGYFIWLNRLGAFGYGGNRPQLLSNPIQRQIYNNSGSAIVGTVFNTAPAGVNKYDYLISVGTITDDFTQITIPDAIIKYDFQHNELSNYKFANKPTAFTSYIDANGDEQFIFGDASGQCYQLNGSTLSDNNNPIEVQLEGVVHLGTMLEKEWKWLRASFNPGNEAKIQIAISDTFSDRTKIWQELGDVSDGVLETRFPAGSRGRFLFWKIYESSTNSEFNFYGFEIDADVVSV